MFKLNLKIALRNLWKNKSYTLINVMGLSIGMASCILIYVFINYQLSFDQSFVNKNRIYRVITKMDIDGVVDYSGGVPIPLAPAIREELPQIEKVAAIQKSGGIVKVDDVNGKERIKTNEDVYFAQPDFFEIFKVKWLSGNPMQSLQQPNTVTLTKETANRYFGNWQNALGKTIRFENTLDLKVSGIIDELPINSSFPLKIIISYATFPRSTNTSWRSLRTNSNCYVLLKEGVDEQEFDKALTQFSKKHYSDPKITGKRGNLLQPLSEIHKDERTMNFANQTTPMKSIIGLGIIGIFLLLTACINFINMATAQAIARSKEVGVRKVMGSSRKKLMIQFMSETTLITFISILLACVIAELSMPIVSNLMDTLVVFSFFSNAGIFVFIAILLLLVSFLAGFYPALIMSRFSPALAVKNKGIISAGVGSLVLRKTLMMVQFAITTLLIVGTSIVIWQMKYVREKPLGFNRESIAMVNLPYDSLSQTRYQLAKARILAIPGVKQVSLCNTAPSSALNHDTNFSYNSPVAADFTINTKFVDQDYFKTFGLQLIAGRNISKSDTLKEYVVNETLLKRLNITNPNEVLAKPLIVDGKKALIVGVVKDFNNVSLKETISPIVISSANSEYETLAIKLESTNVVQTMQSIEKEWKSIFTDGVYGASFLDDQINSYYQAERVTGVLFKLFAALIIFISFIGLFGLVSYVASQRTKEIAVRKVLGASTIELIRMLNSSFLRMVLISNLVAWPIAYLLAVKWLSNFVYRIELSVWPFVLAMCVSLLITIITVSLRSYKVTKANVIDALKYE
ncbi:ABC transporter permease [Pedobacter sp. Hv1]|uniref:ABC transporter permease n=1 Tax=Pedobacter sp. Hv1 TaxID=1740090 RepID=UPI0006D8BE48|nr:ABC transporter permease [Pedobacter sp. Hv1]KQC01681.1 ABC transporter permease [Pedobacter sp. Hv1]